MVHEANASSTNTEEEIVDYSALGKSNLQPEELVILPALCQTSKNSNRTHEDSITDVEKLTALSQTTKNTNVKKLMALSQTQKKQTE